MKDAAIDLPLGRPISKPTLITLSCAVEEFAAQAGSDATVVSLFQRSTYFDPAARRYRTLAASGVTTVVGFAGGDRPGNGIHHVALDDDSPLADEWAVLMASPSLCAYVGGVDLSVFDESAVDLESGRRFRAEFSFDRDVVRHHATRISEQIIDLLPDDVHHRVSAAFDDHLRRAQSATEHAMAAATSVLVDRLELQQQMLMSTRDALVVETERADIDTLTGLLNRSGLQRWLGTDPTATAAREMPPAGLIMIDLDDFKAVNDEHGHVVGDELLALVGIAIRSSVRPGDLVCRWGGDEFLVLCPGTSDDDLMVIADRLLLAITAASVRSARVGASVGVQSASRMPFPPHRADAALYRAKAAGGSTTVVAD
ncbi:MAG: sensor domain-containing diguanylate cyclase [Microthrixaceae bacterium]